MLMSFGLFTSLRSSCFSTLVAELYIAFIAAYVGVHTSINLCTCLCHKQEKRMELVNGCIQNKINSFLLIIGHCCGLLLLLWVCICAELLMNLSNFIYNTHKLFIKWIEYSNKSQKEKKMFETISNWNNYIC